MNGGEAAFRVAEGQERLEGRERDGIGGIHWTLFALPIVFPVIYMVAWASGFLGAWHAEDRTVIPFLLGLIAVPAITWVQTRGQPLLRRLLLHGAAIVIGISLWLLAVGWSLGGLLFIAPVVPFPEVVGLFESLAYILWAGASVLVAVALWPAKPGAPLLEDRVRLLAGSTVGLGILGVTIVAISLLPSELSDIAFFALVGHLEIAIAVVCLVLCSRLIDLPTLRGISFTAAILLVSMSPLFALAHDPQDWLSAGSVLPSSPMGPLGWGFLAAHGIVGATLVALTPPFEGDESSRQRWRYVGGAALFLLAAVLLVAAGENAAGVAGRLLN